MPGDGWQASRSSKGIVGAFQQTAPTVGTVTCAVIPNAGSTDLAANARIAQQTLKSDQGTVTTEQPVRTVNGVDGWVLQGKTSADRFFYEFGTVYNGYHVDCDFTWRTEGDPASDPFAQMIEPVLASIVWK